MSRSGNLTEFIFDIALLSIMPYPGLDGSVKSWDEGHGEYIPYTWDALLAAGMVLVRIRYTSPINPKLSIQGYALCFIPSYTIRGFACRQYPKP